MKKFNHLHTVHKTTGTVTISQDALYSMFASAMKSQWVTSKSDTVVYIAGYLTGTEDGELSQEFADKIRRLVIER